MRTSGTKRGIAAAACAAVGLHLFALPAEAIPVDPAEREGLLRLWAREATLTSSALISTPRAVDMADAHAVAGVTGFLERVRGVVVLGSGEHWPALLRPMLHAGDAQAGPGGTARALAGGAGRGRAPP